MDEYDQAEADRQQYWAEMQRLQAERKALIETEGSPVSSFWDDYKEVGGNFVSGDEKKVLVENGIPFDITQVTKRESGKFGPEWALSVLVPNAETGEPEERTMCFQFGTVGSRDDMLHAAEAYLASEDSAPITCKLEMGGRAVLIRKAA